MFVAHDAGVLEAKIIGVRAFPSRNQNVGSTNRVTASRAIGPNFHFVTNARYSDAIGIESDVNLLVFKDVTDTLGNVRVFTAQQSRRALDNGYLTAELSVHLPELKADVAAADDDQMLGR